MASRFAAAPVRAALEAAYAVNHEIASVAELVREPGLGAIRLQWWREGLEAIAAGASPPREPALQALSIAAPQVAGVLAALTDARAADLEAAPFANLSALHAYIDGTAGVVMQAALMCCGVDAQSDAAAGFIRPAARAWGLAGLARAEPYWRARGRVMLPAGVSVAEVCAQAADAYAQAQGAARALPAEAFAAYGYVALVPLYLRALARGEVAAPAFARKLRLVWASARGKI